ncbi:alpha-ketoglutarate-dependent dioxygenase AlkB family protein [Mucilaginibacter agri]|uniref:Alpha-ketoglutarate-dependent dioxygenase AlkB n=1 Tax=Mucilaginibacter agri TaxID=2695265 RepID=A0A966DSK6_9SPHI|nr:alpha-ketoglutarate-dependent dioxygenase AlkB [Mucilaginibacter agri]NCD69715.1 alpha-ketoglutarate-dependent dioxygenase AlkB [Mucilaginibacter agri]
MDQLSFFEDSISSLPIDIADYIPSMFGKQESEHLLKKFINETPWIQRSVMMYGKEVLTPRLTAWCGDSDADFFISGGNTPPLPWTDDLLMMRERVEAAAGVKFNTVLLNYYRNGNDSVSWHDDQDGIPGRNKIVASVSLGQVRVFDIRNKVNPSIKYSIPLENGSYLLMKGDFQDHWQHRIAKSAKKMKERVNLTFRISNIK